MNYEQIKAKIIVTATEQGKAALNKFLTTVAATILTEAGIDVPAGMLEEPAITQVAKQIASKKKAPAKVAEAEEPEDVEVVVDEAPATQEAEAEEEKPAAVKEPGKRQRATDTEMVAKLTKQLAETPKGAKHDTIKEQLAKYTAKVKAAGKELPKVAAAPAPTKSKVAAPAPEPEEAPKPKVNKLTAKAPAPAAAPAKAAVWNGKCGIIPVKVGSLVNIKSMDFDSTTMLQVRCRVLEVGAGKLHVYPIELTTESGGDPNASNEDEYMWIDILPDGSNIQMDKKKVAKEAV